MALDLNEYLNSRITLDTLGLWHIVKVLVNNNQFDNEPIVTKTMGIRSYDCVFCKKEQEKTNKKHMFCRRHLMLFELRKFYITDDACIFKLKDIIIFKNKYALRKFDNVVIASFSDKNISENDVHRLLKFSFLAQDIPFIKPKEEYDISDLLKVKEPMIIKIENFKITLENTNKGIIVKEFKEGV